MGGMGAKDVPETWEPLVCKSTFAMLLELEETPSTERQDHTSHKTQGE